MRDKIVHAYFSLSLDIIWETVISDVPKLHGQIKEILSAEYPE